MIRTKAEKKGNKWVITGHKWFISAAAEASAFHSGRAHVGR